MVLVVSSMARLRQTATEDPRTMFLELEIEDVDVVIHRLYDLGAGGSTPSTMCTDNKKCVIGFSLCLDSELTESR